MTTGQPSSNVGQSGAESIRFDGMKLEDLPLGQGNEAAAGMSAFHKTDLQNRIDNIKAKYPTVTQSVAYLKGAIKECRENIVRVKETKDKLNKNIEHYRAIIANCVLRDKEMELYDKDNPDHAASMKALRLKYPPYDIDAMKAQIVLDMEGIDRCYEVIEKDYNSIIEVKHVLGLAEQRDREIAACT